MYRNVVGLCQNGYTRSPLHRKDPLGNFAQIDADDIGDWDERIEHLPRSRDKGRRAADALGTGDIPGVGGYQAHLTDRHTEAFRSHQIGCGCGLEAPHGIGGQYVLEAIAQPGVRELRLADRGGGVGERR